MDRTVQKIDRIIHAFVICLCLAIDIKVALELVCLIRLPREASLSIKERLFAGEMNFAACTASTMVFSSASSKPRLPTKYLFCRLFVQIISKPDSCSSNRSVATVLRLLWIPFDSRCSKISFMIAGCSSSVFSHMNLKIYNALFLLTIFVLRQVVLLPLRRLLFSLL